MCEESASIWTGDLFAGFELFEQTHCDEKNARRGNGTPAGRVIGLLFGRLLLRPLQLVDASERQVGELRQHQQIVPAEAGR